MFNEKTREFQKGLDTEARRRNREDDRLKLRKEDRELRLSAKRRTSNNRTSLQTNNQNIQNLGQQNESETLQQLPLYVQGCYADQILTQFECCQRIRKLLSIEHNPPILDVIQSGVIPRLIQFLQIDKYPKLQFEAAWALTNIASGTAEHTAAVIRNGAIPLFIKLLDSSSTDVCEQAIWALGNITGDSPECRNLVLSYKAMDHLLLHCRPHNTNDKAMHSLLRNATWSLANFVRGKPSPNIAYIEQAIPALARLLTHSDEGVISDACWGFSYLSDGEAIKDDDPEAKTKIKMEKQKIQWIKNSGALNILINLLTHSNPQIRHPSLRTIGNIVTGDDEQTQITIDLGVLNQLLFLLESNYNGIKKETCWAISNITAGSLAQIQATIQANIVPALLKIISNDKLEIQKESSWALSNMTASCDEEVIQYLVNQGIIRAFVKLLNCNSQRTVLVVLEGLDNILTVGKKNNNDKYAYEIELNGGLDALETLQANDSISDEIYKKASEIVKEHFNGDSDNVGNDNNNDVETIDAKPQFDNNNQFAFGISNDKEKSSNWNNNSFQF